MQPRSWINSRPSIVRKLNLWSVAKFFRVLVAMLLVALTAFGATFGSVQIPTAQAATIRTVTDCTGYTDTGANTRLSAALAVAASGDTIQFQCSGDIILPATINITTSLTLDATGYSVILDGNHSLEIFNVTSTGNLTLNYLTLTGGNAAIIGGGISNQGNLTITNSTFNHNSASVYGGAIYNFGGTIASITNSTFANNSAVGGGGAIYNSNGGTITSLSKSTFSSNSTLSGSGGAIYSDGSTISSITNSTFANNSAMGGFGGGGDLQ